METTLLTRYRIFKLVFEPNVHDHGSMWTYKQWPLEHFKTTNPTPTKIQSIEDIDASKAEQ